tara:strand:+ start:436 stop:735 length:300 start_codon:yes stop_codon:yes gene_type:complete
MTSAAARRDPESRTITQRYRAHEIAGSLRVDVARIGAIAPKLAQELSNVAEAAILDTCAAIDRRTDAALLRLATLDTLGHGVRRLRQAIEAAGGDDGAK